MPDLSRRSALLLGAGVFGGAALTLAPDAEAATVHTPNRSFTAPRAPGPRRSHFAHLVGTTFTAQGSGRHSLRLVKILDLIPARTAQDEHSFNLIFGATGPREPAGGSYRISAPGLSAISLYLSPVGQRPGPFRLQALVNRSV